MKSAFILVECVLGLGILLIALAMAFVFLDFIKTQSVMHNFEHKLQSSSTRNLQIGNKIYDIDEQLYTNGLKGFSVKSVSRF